MECTERTERKRIRWPWIVLYCVGGAALLVSAGFVGAIVGAALATAGFYVWGFPF